MMSLRRATVYGLVVWAVPLGGPMRMPPVEYIKDIALTYLIIPVITIGAGSLAEQVRRGSIAG